MGSSGRSWSDRAIGTCAVILGCALALNWAWTLLRPLVPVIIGVVIIGWLVGFTIRAAARRREFW